MTIANAEPQVALADELRGLLAEIEAQNAEVESIIAPLSEGQLCWRPAPSRWSVAENLDHLRLTNRRYLRAVRETLAAARARGMLRSGPYRHGRLAERYVRAMEPPPRLRLKTFRSLEPHRDLRRDTVIADFIASQDELRKAIHEADGVDLGRARMRSPFFPLLRLSIGQAFRMMMAHNRRHFWQARQVLGDPHFPT